MNITSPFTASTQKMNSCPLCKNKRAKLYNKIYFNRYSDEVSSLLKISSKNLMFLAKNLKCNNCGLVYKKNWFRKKVLQKIYLKIVSTHPSGWDKISNKFSKKNLREKIEKFKLYIKKSDSVKREKIIILSRIIKSIIFSIKIKNKNDKNLIHNFITFLDKENLKSINKIQKNIIAKINQPKEYSRFKGFEDEKLFNFIESRVGKIDRYAEIGCPLWGMLSMAKKRGCETFFIKPDYSFFWGKNCKKNGIKCINKVSKYTKISNFNNDKNKFDFLGAYAVLDHYDKFIEILNKIFLVSKSAGIIIHKDNGIPIQHRFSLNNKSAKYIAKKFNKKLSINFKNIKISSYKFYLFY